METQTGISFIPSTPMTDDDIAAVGRDYRDHRAARWCAMPTPEQTRIRKQPTLPELDAIMAATSGICLDCATGNHARCLPTGNCTCCQREAVAA